MAGQQPQQQQFSQAWAVGQQGADPPTAALGQQAGPDPAKTVALAERIDQGQHRAGGMI